MHVDLRPVRLREFAVRVHDAFFDKHGERFRRIGGVLAAQTLDRCHKFLKVLIAHRIRPFRRVDWLRLQAVRLLHLW
jgi:hypothetical protein